MKTILYNKTTKQKIWEGNGYTVDGKKPILPKNIVELQVVIGEIPTIDEETQYIESEWVADLKSKKYTLTYVPYNYTEQELKVKKWMYTNYAMRLVIAENVIFMEQMSSFYSFLALEGFPMHKVEDKVYVWMNFIREDHQELINSLIQQNLVQIELFSDIV